MRAQESHDVAEPRTTANLWLGLPIILPLKVIEQLEQKELMPNDLFEVALTEDAITDYGLEAWEVFSLDCPSVKLERLDDRMPAAEGVHRPVEVPNRSTENRGVRAR